MGCSTVRKPSAVNGFVIRNSAPASLAASASGRITLQSVTSAAQCSSEEAKKLVSAPFPKMRDEVVDRRLRRRNGFVTYVAEEQPASRQF